MCVCVLLCMLKLGNSERDGRRHFKVGLATSTCMQVCAGAFMKTLALKCVCKRVCVRACVRGARTCSCDAEHCVEKPVYRPYFYIHTQVACRHGPRARPSVRACEPTVHLSWFQMLFFFFFFLLSAVTESLLWSHCNPIIKQ